MSDGAASFIAIVIGLALLILVCFGAVFGIKSFNRYQKRADIQNQVKINHTRIKFYDQQKAIEKRQADIRVIHAVGIRKAQDEIQATLTPLYVQFEMVQALEDIARSGNNNSLVFVPTSSNGGLPIIPGLTEKAGG